jgi:hypothetical protein
MGHQRGILLQGDTSDQQIQIANPLGCMLDFSLEQSIAAGRPLVTLCISELN